MDTVTGLTAERMAEIEAASVVDGEVVGDNLVLTKHDTTTINAGNVRGPAGPDTAESLAPLAEQLIDLHATGAVNLTDVGFDVILVGGQSNMSGRGTADARLDVSDARVWQYGITEAFGTPGMQTGTHINQISAAVEPLYNSDGPVGLSHALMFARAYAQTVPVNRKVLLVPAAHGGTDMNTHWAAGNPGGTCYENAITWATAALAEAGANARLVAILWLQGEAEVSGSGAIYEPKLDAMIDGFRVRFGIADLPFVLGQIPDFLSPIGNRDQIHAVHINTPRRKTRAGFYYGPTDPTGATYKLADGSSSHYNTLGQRVLGANAPRALRVAKANVLNVDPLPPESLTATQNGTSLLVAWKPPIGRATDYLVEYKLSAAGSWTTLTRAQSIDNTATIAGITKGSTYNVRVSTLNEEGTSTPATATIVTLINPAQVTGLAASTATQTTQPLTWTATPTAASYLVEYKAAASPTWLTATTVTSPAATVPGLNPETSYNYRVSAINTAGTGTASAMTTASTLSLVTLLQQVGASAWGAYSVVRRVKGGYSGPLIRVRRSSDDAELDIGMVAPGVLDQAALLTHTGAGNGFVVTLYDQSGNTRHVTQVTPTAQLRIVSAGVVDKIAGLPSMIGTASTGMKYTGVGLYAAGAASISAITKSTSPGAIAGEAKTSSAIPYYWPLTSAGNGQGAGRAIRADNGSYNLTEGNSTFLTMADELHQLDSIDTGTNLKIRNNRVADTDMAYTRSLALTPDNFAVFCNYRDTILGIAGNHCEVIVWASALSNADRDAAALNQKNYYGTP